MIVTPSPQSFPVTCGVQYSEAPPRMPPHQEPSSHHCGEKDPPINHYFLPKIRRDSKKSAFFPKKTAENFAGSENCCNFASFSR